jgi:hypothetical protein
MRQKFLKSDGGLQYYIAAGCGIGAYARDDDDARMMLMEYFRADGADACLAEWARLGYKVRLAN